MPEDLKNASLRPILKKPNADCEQFSNFRPVSNLKFLSKLVEKTVFVQLNNCLTVNGSHESFQSAYKAHHSTETSLLTITDDILLSLDRGDNVFLLLLTCQQHLTQLVILCYFRVWRTRLASRELFCSGFILICGFILIQLVIVLFLKFFCWFSNHLTTFPLAIWRTD